MVEVGYGSYGDLSYLWALGMINPIATYTSVYNLYIM